MRLNALKQILALLHTGEETFPLVSEDAFGFTLNLQSLLLSAQFQLLLGTLGPEVVRPSSQPPGDSEGFLLLHYQVLSHFVNIVSSVLMFHWTLVITHKCCIVHQDDIKATSRRLQDEIQEAVHCLYQSLVAILERTSDATCGKGTSCLFHVFFSCWKFAIHLIARY